MRSSASVAVPSVHPGIGFAQFVVLIAALMALSALGIDSMLPALPAISKALGFADANRRQWIVTSYVLGFGGAQILYGTLADRYGRKPVLLSGLVLYIAFSVMAAFANSFDTIVIARVLQGVGAASTRVVPVSIVRDCYAGRQMARVMSLTSVVFMAVPVMAPTIGQTIIWLAPWQWEFGMLAIGGLGMVIWAIAKLPETLPAEDRAPIEPAKVLHAFRLVLDDRLSMGYTLAGTFLVGAIFGFVNSAQQLFADVFHAANLFTAVFALVALFIALASFVNARLVNRLGTRLISHVALIAFTVLSVVHVSLALLGAETLVIFTIIQAGAMFSFGMAVGNFNAMAMENLGHVAGTAAAVQGFISMLGAALIGVVIGQYFNGTMIPLASGYAVCGVAALGAALVAERGRLFTPHETPLLAADGG